MGFTNARVLLPALALFALSCAPHHPCGVPDGAPCHGHRMEAAVTRACGSDECAYKSQCYSDGAIRSAGGACQECSSSKWVSSTGCSSGEGCKMDCRMGCKMGAKPCDHGSKHRHPGN
jgi:hypothetical protein